MTSSGNDQTLPSGSATHADKDEAYCAACNQSFAVDHEFCPNDGAKLVKLTARPDTLLGRVFDGRYEIRTALGHGGMGTVYRGWQRSVDREVAIKVIHPKLASERAVAKRFLREARLSSRLSYPNIVNVYDFGQSDDGILYLVMELLRGHTLSKELEAQRPLPLRRIVTIATQVCDALDAAHSQDIVHRDLKPGNILILDEPPGRDVVKILDFGLAKSLTAETTSLVTQTDALLGTPLYMPPEQILGKPSDQRADLYSLGCILYQMACGRPPFVGENINITLAAHVQSATPPLPLTVPPSLSAVIVKLMMKEPADRYATAREVRDAIAGLAGGSAHEASSADGIASMLEPSSRPTVMPPATDPGTASSLPSVERRRSRWIGWIPVLALVVLAGVVVTIVKLSGGGAAPGSSTDAAAPAIAPTIAIDAAAGGVAVDVRAEPPADAPVVIDAARVAPDARVPGRRVDAGVRVVPPLPDAAIVHPALPPDAAVAPKPDIGLLPTGPKKP